MDLEEKSTICEYCQLKCKNQAGLMNHIHRRHKIEERSGLDCWTCGKQFTKQEILEQHYQTVLHQINCRKIRDEMSEMPQSIQEIVTTHQEKREKERKRPYRSRLYERPITSSTQKRRKREKIPVQHLRDEPAIIPLEQTSLQADPRTEPIMSWIDLTDFEVDFSSTNPEPPETTTEDLLESTSTQNTTDQAEATFTDEITQLFEIPPEEIPRSQKILDFQLDLPELNLQDTEDKAQCSFSFLDYLTDQNII